jgi:hypothetical protein
MKNEVLELNEPSENVYKIFTYPISLNKIDHVFGEKPNVIKFHKD